MAEASLPRIIFIKWTWKAIYKARVVFVTALRWGRKGANSIISSSMNGEGGWILSPPFKNQLLVSFADIWKCCRGSTHPPPTMPSLSSLYKSSCLLNLDQLQSFWAIVCVTTGIPGWKRPGTCSRCFSFKPGPNYGLPSDLIYEL